MVRQDEEVPKRTHSDAIAIGKLTKRSQIIEDNQGFSKIEVMKT
jgi:hypothetical protein